MNSLIRMICLGVMLMTLVSCSTDHNEKEVELRQLFMQEKALSCELQAMKEQVRQDWDSINMLLDKNLPEDMPEEEKTNMLKVRNANLIRMFESFEEVDEEVKEALKDTELRDQAVTKKLVVLKKKAGELEARKNILLEELSHAEGEKALSKYKAILSETLKEACD